MTVQLSKDFSLEEFTRSESAVRHGISMDVEFNSQIHFNLKRLCIEVLQPLRDTLGPVTIISGYRPEKLNTLIGGAPTSQHVTGHAADIVVSGYSPLDVARWIRDHVVGYDQVIHEFGQWCHVSIAPEGVRPRVERLTAFKVERMIGKPKTVYLRDLMSVEEAKRRAS